MSFLTPFFLFGALAIAGPILYHLVRRTTRDRTIFSSLMFLLPSPPRISKRHRLEHLLLLALRCLALGLLALGFARPFIKETSLVDPSAAQPKRTLILLDTSASMQRDGVWAAARERAEELLRRSAPTDHVALFTFDRVATPRLSFEEWNRTAAPDRIALATSRLAMLQPGWGGTHLGSALVTAAESLAEAETTSANGAPRVATGVREIVLVSDVQAGSRLEGLQAYEWPKQVALRIEAVKARQPTNAALQLVAEAPDAARSADAAVRVRVTNASESKREQFKVGWMQGAGEAFAGAAIDAYVPPGQSRVFSVAVPKDTPGLQRIALTGDDERFDNAVSVLPPVTQRAAVLWLGGEAVDDTRQPLFFLRRAFVGSPRVNVEVTPQPAAAALAPDRLENAALLFVADALPNETSGAIRSALEAGKVGVLVLRTPAQAETLRSLVGAPAAVPMAETKPANYAMLAEIDFQHPLFAAFADPRFSDFTKIHVWRYRRVDPAALPGARVVAKFDSGDPAVLDVPVGRGRLIVFTTGWQPDDSQLAVSSKFVPLMWTLLDMTGRITPVTTQFFVGDTVPVPEGATAVRLPNGETGALRAGEPFVASAGPGLYEFTGFRPQRFAVNLDANEGRTTALNLDELGDLGLPVAKPAPETAAATEKQTILQATEAESRQKLWRWFIAATLAVLLIETLLAGRAARRTGMQTGEGTS